MKEHAFGKFRGSWRKPGLRIVAAIAGAVLVAWNYYFVVQLFAGLIVYSAVAIPVLVLIFVLVLAEEAGMEGIARMGRMLSRQWHRLEVTLTRPLGQQRQGSVRPLVFVPRLMRELHKANKAGFHLPIRRRAA